MRETCKDNAAGFQRNLRIQVVYFQAALRNKSGQSKKMQTVNNSRPTPYSFRGNNYLLARARYSIEMPWNSVMLFPGRSREPSS